MNRFDKIASMIAAGKLSDEEYVEFRKSSSELHNWMYQSNQAPEGLNFGMDHELSWAEDGRKDFEYLYNVTPALSKAQLEQELESRFKSAFKGWDWKLIGFKDEAYGRHDEPDQRRMYFVYQFTPPVGLTLPALKFGVGDWVVYDKYGFAGNYQDWSSGPRYFKVKKIVWNRGRSNYNIDMDEYNVYGEKVRAVKQHNIEPSDSHYEKTPKPTFKSKPQAISKSKVNELARRHIRWFSEDGDMEWSTREHGDVGSETPGRADIDAAMEFNKAVLKAFPGHVVEVEPVDEWVHVSVRPAKGTEIVASKWWDLDKVRDMTQITRMSITRTIGDVQEVLKFTKGFDKLYNQAKVVLKEVQDSLTDMQMLEDETRLAIAEEAAKMRGEKV